ncbi:MAG: hypothetical protein R3D25_06050 [Geminicoccaceae bacterium]
MRERLDLLGHSVPLVGDFHYNGHRLWRRVPELGASLAKLRINPAMSASATSATGSSSR